MKKILILATILSTTFACSEEALDTYPTDDNGVYFGVLNTVKSEKNVYTDKTEFSFAEYKGDEYVIELRVNALGNFASYDRPIDFQIMADSTTAIEGTDFARVAEPNLIKANETGGVIRLKLMRTAKITSTAMTLRLKLVENSEFSLPLPFEMVDVINNKYIHLNEHKITFFDFISEPARWKDIPNLKAFSPDKYRLVNDLCNLTKDNWVAFFPAEGMLRWIRIRNYLQQKIDAGTPVTEKRMDGTVGYMSVEGLINEPK